MRQSFQYNENKVKDGVARCILAENYPLELDRLSEQLRLKMLSKMAELNTRTKINSVHISLNFDPSETISEDRCKEIARTYMDGIGFGNQPYLVYQHFDAGHPHLHILTTNIQMDGSRISLHHLGIKKSEPVRKEIEQKFGLVKAEGRETGESELRSAYSSKAEYGKGASRKAISVVLNTVLNDYKYTSLYEVNAVLKLYNVKADRGSKTSRTYTNNGLYYRILDESGKPVGVPIKASSFYNKPTLKFLEERFVANRQIPTIMKEWVKLRIDLYFQKPGIRRSLGAFIQALKRDRIMVVLRQSEGGKLYGITYVDLKSKAVFNGSVLGREYSAKAIVDRCGDLDHKTGQSTNTNHDRHSRNDDPNHVTGGIGTEEEETGITAELIADLMSVENSSNSEQMPYELSGRKRKFKTKRRRL